MYISQKRGAQGEGSSPSNDVKPGKLNSPAQLEAMRVNQASRVADRLWLRSRYGPSLLLLVLDTVALTLATAAGASAAAIVYLAHNGNPNTNWLAICQQFGDFCQRVSGAVVAAFATVVALVTLVVVSAIALRKS